LKLGRLDPFNLEGHGDGQSQGRGIGWHPNPDRGLVKAASAAVIQGDYDRGIEWRSAGILKAEGGERVNLRGNAIEGEQAGGPVRSAGLKAHQEPGLGLTGLPRQGTGQHRRNRLARLGSTSPTARHH
jgi:hypothetical protein